MAGPMTPSEALDVQKIGEGLQDRHLVEGLKDLLTRESELLKGPLGDGEDRMVTLHNITVLAAAAARIESGPEPADES